MFKNFNTNLQEIESNVQIMIEENYDTIETPLKAEPSYENFVKPFEKMEDALELEFTQISNINSVNNSEESQERYAALLPIITEYSRGGRDSMKNLFQEFLGREPKIDNLLKISGIA